MQQPLINIKRKITKEWMDQLTNAPMDKAGYRVACTKLKAKICFFSINDF